MSDLTVEEIRAAIDLGGNGDAPSGEPLTYRRDAQQSYFRDRFMAEIQGDEAAKSRLERHAKEMDVEIPKLQKRMAETDVEYRINPNRIDGTGGFFSPPIWMNQYFATAPRPKRVLAGMIPNFDLPAKASEVKLPRLTTGTKTDVDVDGSVVEDTDFIDAASESWVMTVSGDSDVSIQLLEQSPPGAHLDYAIMKDLSESYDGQLENYLFTGTGKANQQITGILNLATGATGVHKVSYTGSHGYELFTALGEAAAELGDNRELPPEAWLMRTARWAYLGSSVDEEKLPLAVPGHQAIVPVPYTFDADRPAVAPPILGWPTYLSDAIPANLGSGANQDVIVCCRPTDSMLFESDQRTSVFTEVLSGTLQARFQLSRYAAALFRYPMGFSVVEGSGMVVKSGF